jgi:hypothetical protein
MHTLNFLDTFSVGVTHGMIENLKPSGVNYA